MIEKYPIGDSHRLAKNSSGTSGATDAALAAKDASSDAEPRLYQVEIAGVALRLKSSHDQKTVNELVALVDGKIREALPLTKTGSVQNATILASLNLAEEFLILKRKAKHELTILEDKALKLISELEKSQSNGAVEIEKTVC